MKKEERNIDMTNSNFYTIIAINTGYSTFNNNNFHTIGNVEIGEASGSPINNDVTKANEVIKDVQHSTNINVESQTIEYATNPGKLKEDLNKAKDEIKDVTKALDNSIHDPGDDNRNFFGQLRETRLSETVNNIAGERLKVASTQNEIKSAFEEAYSDLGYKAEIKFSTPEETPELKDKAGTAYVSSTGVHTMIININAKENSTKSGLIGTISEEGSHIINGVEGRQIETGTEEKGLESTGRATNSYFQDKYRDDKTTISMKSDGTIDTSKLGTHVGDIIIFKDTKDKNGKRKSDGIIKKFEEELLKKLYEREGNFWIKSSDSEIKEAIEGKNIFNYKDLTNEEKDKLKKFFTDNTVDTLVIKTVGELKKEGIKGLEAFPNQTEILWIENEVPLNTVKNSDLRETTQAIREMIKTPILDILQVSNLKTNINLKDAEKSYINKFISAVNLGSIDDKVNLTYIDLKIDFSEYDFISKIESNDDGTVNLRKTKRKSSDAIFAHEVLGHFYTFMQVAMNPNGKITDFHFLNSKNSRIAGEEKDATLRNYFEDYAYRSPIYLENRFQILENTGEYVIPPINFKEHNSLIFEEIVNRKKNETNGENSRILYDKIEVNDVLKVKDKKGLFDENEIK